MTTMEVILVTFAMVFFTSIALIYNRSAWNQKENLYDANSFVQASILAHEALDEIDAKLFSKQVAFDDIRDTFRGEHTRVLAYTGETYLLDITVTDTDSTGAVLSNPPANNIFTKVTVLVRASAGMKRDLSMSRIYTKTHLNL